MLVFADGSQAGTLGGGCVEAEVRQQALRLLHAGTRRLLTFQLDHDYGWDDGLICGGRMTLLADPIRDQHDWAYFLAWADAIESDVAVTEVIVSDENHAGCGDRFLLDDAGNTIASRAGGDLPEEALANLRDVARRPRPYYAAGLAFLPCLPRCRLVIVGAGHVGQKVAALAADVGFRVWVVDDREDCCSAARFPQAEQLLVGPMESLLNQLQPDANTFCIVVTRGHNHDQVALMHLAKQPSRYLGMIGSRRKIRLIFDNLRQAGIPAEALSRVRAPLGLDIGSQTVPEIAVSIVAELIACRSHAGDFAAQQE